MADIRKKLKLALISGAAHALKFKNLDPRATDEDIIQQVNRESGSIVNKLDSED
ncbi:MAG: hypothetical protein AABX11_01015 [Nanoarchaeota archaeon]